MNAKVSNNTLKYLFKGKAFRNDVEDEDAPHERRDVEDSKDELYDFGKYSKANLVF